MEEIIIQARFESMIFHNSENCYSVARFSVCEEDEKEMIVVGYFDELIEEVVYELSGVYVNHARYGLQFQVSAYKKVLPKQEEAFIRFLSSSIFPGIGKATAKQIVAYLAEDPLEKIKENIEIFYEMSFLSSKKQEVLVKNLKDFMNRDENIIFLTSFQLSMTQILKIEEVYKQDIIEKIQTDPYQLVYDVEGIGFQTADKIAMQLEFGKDDQKRLQALIYTTVLNICMATGNTYVTLEELSYEVAKDSNLTITQLQEYMQPLLLQRLLIVEDQCIYHHTQYDAECGICEFLRGFPYYDAQPIKEEDCRIQLEAMQKAWNIQYDQQQLHSILNIINEPFSILTGGPGTGKTTIVKALIQIYKNCCLNHNIYICAPTGRAAKRLSQLSDCNATTIHSLLKWDLNNQEFLKNDKDPLECDILIIDEFSMVDSYLFYHLLRASKKIKKIIIIGDDQQLPSVAPGQVLKDLIDSNLFPTYRLTTIYRQSEGSGVVQLAHEMKENLPVCLENKQDIAFISCNLSQVQDAIIKIVRNALEKGYSKEDIQVLAPMYQGSAGIDQLNYLLQQTMQDTTRKSLRHAHRTFYVEDKILQLKNQPEDDVYNGDIGIVKDILEENGVEKTTTLIVSYDGHEVAYTKEQLLHITHAYCISIHKSQGSEYPIVILPVFHQYRHMLQKRLYYTAITRAKKSLILIGEKQAFDQAITTISQKDRKSRLQSRLRNKIV